MYACMHVAYWPHPGSQALKADLGRPTFEALYYDNLLPIAEIDVRQAINIRVLVLLLLLLVVVVVVVVVVFRCNVDGGKCGSY